MSLGTADSLAFTDAAVLDDDARPCHIGAAPRRQLDARNGRDARQRFPEPEGVHIVEIVNGQDFACGMALEGQGHVTRFDARTVVGNPDHLFAAAAQFDRDVRGARVKGILEEPFTMDEGRSMTSPAAIFEATSSGRTVILRFKSNLV